MRVCIVNLGAFGDICAVGLPIAFHEFQQGNHVTFIIAKEFASLLDGVTYVEREIWDGHYSEPLKAAEWAEKSGRFDSVLVSQCYGSPVERQTDSFCKESWRLVGKLHLWGKIPLVFDNRDRVRENALSNSTAIEQVGFVRIVRTKPLLLVCHSGNSSPFPNRIELLDLLDKLQERFSVLDISDLRCDHFYDLLGLYDIAACLVATDSGPLHLTNAVPTLPVIALVTDSPDAWHGSPAQPNHVLRIRYSQFNTKSAQEAILRTLMDIAEKKKPERRLIHVWNDYNYRQHDAQHRHEIAKASWEQEYKKGRWIPFPVFDAQLSRNANSVGEAKPLPFVNDLINLACDQAQPDDLIVLTNDDTIFVDGLTERLLNANPPFWSSRWEHAKVKGPLNADSIRRNSWKHVGADIFVFTKRWWMEHGSEFPDMLVAREAWDLVLRTLIDRRGGHEEDALCAHIIHDPEWHSPEQRECVGNLFNRNAAREFFKSQGMPWPKV